MKGVDLMQLYQQRVEESTKQLAMVKESFASVAWLRIVVGITLVILLYFATQVLWLWIPFLFCVSIFIFLVIKHEKLGYKRKLLECKVEINRREIRALGNDFSMFDDGEELLQESHPYAGDLDLFGRKSLFQRINRTCTETGKDRLAFMLCNPLKTKSDILNRQEAIRELSSKVEFRQEFQAIGMTSDEKKEDQISLLKWLELQPMFYGKKFYQLLTVILPFLTILGLAFWVYSGMYGAFVLMFLVQWTVVGIHSKKVFQFQEYIGKKRHLLEKFSKHFSLIQNEATQSEITAGLKAQSEDADRNIKRLASLSRTLDLRLNMLATTLLNGVFLHDIRSVINLEKWREENKSKLVVWLETIAEMDALSSCAGFTFNHPEFCFPEIEDEFVFDAVALGHPLLNSSVRVCQNIHLSEDNSVWIVTGANMAGKSTFLRSIGINTVLALCGMVVCAEKMKCPILGIYTGMRTTDSINENQSYFFAELLRLQMIVERLQSGQRLLVLLDEILKGTNSGDKLNGSEQLVKRLVNFPSFTLVATHDIALGALSQTFSRIQNYHFETFIEGDKLSFDYKLKPGVSTSKNATFLMEKMGIIDKGSLV